MLGLTSFNVFDWYKWTGNDWQINDDKNTWNLMKATNFRILADDLNSVYFLFSSASFPFFKGRTERISMSMLFAYETLTNLNSSDHYTPNLKTLKEIAQVIYERDYRFAQAPLMPTLTATPGDGKVILTWDDMADKHTREPLLENENDFEGYKIYRATDKLMSDAEVITDGQGTTMFKKPIFQCDKIDSIEGYADFGLVGGTAYYLGDETGVSHHFIDENVQNGRAYYYAIVAYDYGIEKIAGGLSPAENNVVIELNEAEEIIRMGRNVAVVTPGTDAAGFRGPQIALSETSTQGNAQVSVEVVDRKAIKPNHTYKVKFRVDTLGNARKNAALRHELDYVRVNNGLKVYDVTENNHLVYEENPNSFPLDNILADGETRVSDNYKTVAYRYYRHDKEILTDLFDGIQIHLSDLAQLGEIDDVRSGWIVGDAAINVQQSVYESHGFPSTYDIVFSDDAGAHSSEVTRSSYIFNLEGGKGTYSGSAFIQMEILLGTSSSF